MSSRPSEPQVTKTQDFFRIFSPDPALFIVSRDSTLHNTDEELAAQRKAIAEMKPNVTEKVRELTSYLADAFGLKKEDLTNMENWRVMGHSPNAFIFNDRYQNYNLGCAIEIAERQDGTTDTQLVMQVHNNNVQGHNERIDDILINARSSNGKSDSNEVELTAHITTYDGLKSKFQRSAFLTEFIDEGSSSLKNQTLTPRTLLPGIKSHLTGYAKKHKVDGWELARALVRPVVEGVMLPPPSMDLTLAKELFQKVSAGERPTYTRRAHDIEAILRKKNTEIIATNSEVSGKIRDDLKRYGTLPNYHKGEAGGPLKQTQVELFNHMREDTLAISAILDKTLSEVCPALTPKILEEAQWDKQGIIGIAIGKPLSSSSQWNEVERFKSGVRIAVKREKGTLFLGANALRSTTSLEPKERTATVGWSERRGDDEENTEIWVYDHEEKERTEFFDYDGTKSFSKGAYRAVSIVIPEYFGRIEITKIMLPSGAFKIERKHWIGNKRIGYKPEIIAQENVLDGLTEAQAILITGAEYNTFLQPAKEEIKKHSGPQS